MSDAVVEKILFAVDMSRMIELLAAIHGALFQEDSLYRWNLH